MNLFHKKLSTFILGAVLALGVGVGVSGIKKVENPALALEDKTLIVDGSKLTSTATTKDTEFELDGFTFVVSKGAKAQSASGDNKFSSNATILIGKKGTYIYNKTPIGTNIKSFKIFYNKGAAASATIGINFSSSAISKYDSSSAYTQTMSVDSVFDVGDKVGEGNTYFWYQVTNSKNTQIQFEITYTPEDKHSVLIKGDNIVEKGKTIQLTASCVKEDAITWKSSNDAVATVSETGLVTGVSDGTATITATCAADASGTIEITVYSLNEVVKGLTIAEVLSKDIDKNQLYEIKGVITGWYTTNKGSQQSRGAYYLIDFSVAKTFNSLFVYNSSAEESCLGYDGKQYTFKNDYQFMANELTKSAEIGSEITLLAYGYEFYGTREYDGLVTSVKAPSAESFALLFLNSTTAPCTDPENDNLSALDEVWDDLSSSFSKLSADEQTKVKVAVANASGSDLENAVARYDHILSKYTSLKDFIGRISTSGTINRNKVDSNNTFVIVLISVLSVAFLAGAVSLVYVKKRKSR